jgi:hypothetical protein
MTEKRFYLLNYNNYPIYDSLNDKEYNAQFKVQREKLCLLLNELAEENQHIKNTIKEAYNNERTQLGKSVLKQLMEAIQ